MNVSVPAWIFLGIATFLIFIMVFVSTGAIDDIRMENYSPQTDLYSNEFEYKNSAKPSWSKSPENILPVTQSSREGEKKSLHSQ